jgi:iron complex outermembrane receptor protein
VIAIETIGRRRGIRFFAAAFAVAGTQAALAQSIDHGSLEQLFGEPVTTSVTGSPQRASQVPATMEIITAEDIRRSGARDIPGVLQGIAGVDVLRWGTDHSDVAIRGYNQAFSPRLLVLINGRQVYADYYGFTPWATLPVELAAIRQIEVVKGPNAALFGFNAVGGVINIITYDPLYDDVRNAAASGGTQSFGEFSGVTALRFSDDAALLINAGVRRNDDFAPQAGLPNNSRDALALDLRLRLTEKVHAGIEATYSGVDQLETGPTYAPVFPEYTTTSIKGQVAADSDYGLFQATLYHNEIDNDVVVLGDLAPPFTINNRVTVLQLQDVFKVGTAHTIRAAVEYRENSMETISVEGGEVFYDVVSTSGMWNWTVSSAITWTNAVRVDRLSLGREGSVPPGYGLSNSDWDRSLTESSFNSGLIWALGDTDTLRFMIGRGAQLPSLVNLGGGVFPSPPFGFAGGHPSVEPSIVTHYEAGWERALQALGANLRVDVYRGQTREMVAFLGGNDFAAGLVSTAANVGDSKTAGLEVSIDGTVGASWRWSGSYAHQKIRDRMGAGFTVENTYVNFEDTLPQHMLRGGLGWSSGSWEIDGYLRYQSDFDSVADAGFGAGVLVPISAFISVDGRAAYRLTPRTTLALAAQNLNRSEQRQTSAAPVERRVVASLTMDF